MRKKTPNLILWGVILGLVALSLFLALKPPKQVIHETDMLSICKAQSEARLEALGTFCTLLQDQYSPEDCLKLDYVKKVGLKTGNKWIGECAGTWLGDTRPEVPTTTKGFESYRNVDAAKHR